MNTNISYIITGSGNISMFLNGKPYTIDKHHANYGAIIEKIRAGDGNDIEALVDISKSLIQYSADKIKIIDGSIYYNGTIIHNTLTTRIISFMRDKMPFQPLVNFMANMMENPSKRAVDELYLFLERGENPITEDGHFLAFKNVRSDYKDIHSGTFDNTVGSICEMPRNQVCDNASETCSNGLHFCSINYLPNFVDSNNGKTMILKINPKDVVSIPIDYAHTKGRCSRYEVVAEYKEDWRSKIAKNDSGFDYPLYSEDGSDLYDDEDGYCYATPPSNIHNLRDSYGRFVKKSSVV